MKRKREEGSFLFLEEKSGQEENTEEGRSEKPVLEERRRVEDRRNKK